MSNAILSYAGVVLPYSAQFEQLIHKYDLVHEQQFGAPKRMYPIRTDGKYIIFPKFIFKKEFDTPVTPKLPPIQYKTYNFLGEINTNNKLIADHTLTHYDDITSGFCSTVLNMGAGLGKTYVAAYIISRLGLSTLFITKNKELRGQADADFAKILDAKVDTIVINSALNLPDFKKYSFIIFDEVHEMCSQARSKIFHKCGTWAMLGMSATTERTDGFEKFYQYYLGDVEYAKNIDGYDVNTANFNSEVKVIHYRGPPQYTQNLTHEITGEIFVPYILKQFMDDDDRFDLVIQEIKGLEGKNLFVFSGEIAMLEKLKEKLDKVGIEADLFTGKTEKKKLDGIRKEAKVILTTYSYSSTGLSINRMDAILFLTPRKSNMIQILARILRRGGNTDSKRIIVDIVDEKTVLKHQLKERLKAYKFYGMKVSHTSI